MKKKYIITIHILLWIYLIYPEFMPVFFYKDKLSPYYLQMVPLNILFHASIFYTFYLFLIPAFLKLKKKHFFSFVFGAITLVAFTFIKFIIFYIYDKYLLHIPDKELTIQTLDVISELRTSLVLSLYGSFTQFTISWFQNQKQKTELITQKQAGEIALLRSQINPHFLFNTLNNIYSLVYQKSDDAPTAVMRLSEIMRYMLYDSNTNEVVLKNEVNYLNSFIELQQLRMKNKEFVQFVINGNIENKTISPMLLIPFVENAFKHGIKNTKSIGISIFLNVLQNEINFEVLNFHNKSNKINKDHGKGIGLSNVKRRLELIYPNRHNLEITQTDNQFRIFLQIKNN
jgi:two-component system LytT family sensor kinase